MSADQSRTTSLVHQSIPESLPRAVQAHLYSVTEPTGTATVARVLHTIPGVRDLVQFSSNAHWSDCEVLVVPTPAAANSYMHVTLGFSPDGGAPAALQTLWSLPTCQFHSSGGKGLPPQVARFSLNFLDARTSPLLKPAPIELSRTAVVMNFAFCDDEGIATTGTFTEPMAMVFVRGHLVLGGQG